MAFEVCARARAQRVPAAIGGDGRGFVQRRGALLVHLEEQQETDLPEIIAERHALVAQDVGIVPHFGDKRLFVHWTSSPRKAAVRMDWRSVEKASGNDLSISTSAATQRGTISAISSSGGRATGNSASLLMLRSDWLSDDQILVMLKGEVFLASLGAREEESGSQRANAFHAADHLHQDLVEGCVQGCRYRWRDAEDASPHDANLARRTRRA